MMLCSVFFSFMVVVFTFAEEIKPIQVSRRLPIVDNVLEGLQLETWSNKETACINATRSILHGVKNNTLWASWVWDSMQLPVGTYYGTVFHLGNFDQCLQVPWPSQPGLLTQYCLLDVKLTALNDYDGEVIDPYDENSRYIGAKFRFGRRLNTIFLGVCLPISCQSESIAKISRVIFKQSHLPFQDVTVDPRDCQASGALAKPVGYFVFWSIILAMVFICVLVYFLGNTLNNSDSTIFKISRCFCLSRNVDSLMEVRKDAIRAMDGIRTLTCAIIVLGHYFFMIQFVALINKTDAEKELLSDPVVKRLIHLDITVDTFIMMSGLLYTRGLMTSKSCQPFKTMLKRYLRLVPLYALSIMCITYVLPNIGSGPAWPRLVREVYEPCTRSWWTNFLMITNKVDEEAFCSITGWYIHFDFQLTVLMTAIFIVSLMSKRLGFMLCVLGYGITLVVSVIWNYWGELPGILLYDFGPESQNMVTNKVYNTVYTSIYTKSSAYFIGIAMGYFMSVYKPQNYRKTITKLFSILGFMTGMFLLLWTLDIGAELFKKEYSALWSAFLVTIDKTIWSVGVCVIILVCEYGTLPIINNLLSSKAFVPLSKLTYSIYLVHAIFIYRNILSLRTPATYDISLIMTHGLGYLVICCATSYLIWMFIEAPITNLTNLMFDFKRNADKQQSGNIQVANNIRIGKEN